jgi:hypothetical protein
MKNHHHYGWKKLYHRANFVGVQFNTGVTIYFKSWRQDFQSSTIDAVFVDEEIPFDKFDELQQRLNMAEGMFSMVFTATLGQREWFEVIELRGKRNERFPEAFKRQVSLEYDCKEYADGTPSPFTDEEVARRKANCSSEREVNRRIHGRFVSDEGLAFPSFQRSINFTKKTPTDMTWQFFGGVDVGTGGREGHPAAISIVAVDQKFRKGKLYKFWRGNKYETTTTTDILNKYVELTKGLNMTDNRYDWHSKEFFLRAQAAGIPFNQADKARDFGFDLLNTLFRNQMLDIEDIGDAEDLVFELENLKQNEKKTTAIDDGCFAAGTMIQADCGEKKIEDIAVGDYVYTRKGLKRVVSLSRHVADIYEFSLPGNKSIQCTDNHKFYLKSKDAFCPIKNCLNNQDFLEFSQWQEETKLFSTILFSEDIQIPLERLTADIISRAGRILEMAFRPCIKRFGSIILAKSRKSITSTTKMVMSPITQLKTLSAFMNQNTVLITQENTYLAQRIEKSSRSIWKELGRLLKLGTDLKRGTSFIKRLVIFPGKIKSQLKWSVNSVALNILDTFHAASFAAMPVNLNIEGLQVQTTWRELALCAARSSQQTNTQKQRVVREDAQEGCRGKFVKRDWVYNITVEGEHEYFAQGVLVANCDSLRYAVATIPWDFSHITNEPVPMQVVEKKPKVNSRHENPYDPTKHENEWSVDEDIDEFMELLGGY